MEKEDRDEFRRQADEWMKENDYKNRAMHGDKGYHYLGSLYTFYAIGKAFGEAMPDIDKKE